MADEIFILRSQQMIGQTFFRCDTRGAKRREAATARSAGVDPEKQTQARRPDRRRAENFKKKRLGSVNRVLKLTISSSETNFEVNFFKNISLQPLKIMIWKLNQNFSVRAARQRGAWTASRRTGPLPRGRFAREARWKTQKKTPKNPENRFFGAQILINDQKS